MRKMERSCRWFLLFSCGATLGQSCHCPWTNRPVCDQEGRKYANECLAACQNVITHACSELDTMNHRGLILADEADANSSKDGETTSSPKKPTLSSFNLSELPEQQQEEKAQLIPDDIVQRYSGWKLTGRVEPTSRSGSLTTKNEDDYDNYDDSSISSPVHRLKQIHAAAVSKRVATRVTRDGYLYQQPLSDSTDHDNRKSKRKGRRNLRILGQDDRHRINDTTDRPYAAVAQMDYTYKLGGCTATLIAPHAAVTSAHCVWRAGEWEPLVSIAPGRFRHDGNVYDPYGSFVVEAMTVLEEWRTEGEPHHDIAVLTLAPQEGVSRDPCSDGSEFFDYSLVHDLAQNHNMRQASITGYPSDKLHGTQWKAGPQCTFKDEGRSDFMVHDCDTTSGMSGSAVVAADGTVVGVHGYGFNRGINGAVMLDQTLYRAIRNWIALDGEQIAKQRRRQECLERQQDTSEPTQLVTYQTEEETEEESTFALNGEVEGETDLCFCNSILGCLPCNKETEA